MQSHSEQVVTMAIRNPASAGLSRTFRFAGKADLIEGGVLYDWKTVSDVDAYLQKRAVGFQMELYALACQESLGVTISRVVYRLISKPSIKYCAKDKTPADYEQRCIEWLSDPGKLMEVDSPILPSKVRAAQEWLWDTSQGIIQARARNRWLTNEDACHRFQRLCEYHDLCAAYCDGRDVDSIAREAYTARSSHVELPTEYQDKDMLTYSSGRDFCSCQQLYYWKHEARIEKPHASDDSDALRIGSCVHAGLDAAFTSGMDAGLEAIATWLESNPVLGEDAARKQDQDAAKSRAMVRMAAARWL